MTFNNDLSADYAHLEAYNEFRAEATKLKFRHFLEVFNPNAPKNLSPEQIKKAYEDIKARVRFILEA